MKTQLKAALASVAFAAFGPMASIAGAPAVTPGFQGWYVGAHAAYEFGDADIETGKNGVGPARTFGDDVDGWGAGLQAGYNHVMGRWLLGAEVSATGLEVDGVSTNPGGPPISFESEYNWRADITARLGYLVTDKTALYIEGGWSFAEVELHSVINAGPYDRVNNDDVVDGWTAGIGIEHKLNDGVSAFVEYSYTDYGSDSFINTNGGPAALIEHDNELQAVKVGLNFKLN
jgi:outer membrane immunogenic protein